MKGWTLALLLATVAIIAAVSVVGCISQKSENTAHPMNATETADTIQKADKAGIVEYIGLEYGLSRQSLPPADLLYYTGQSYNGSKIYVPGWANRTERVPLEIAINNSSGFIAYSRMAENPSVYAYTLCGAYNTNESIIFGLMDERGGKVELRNAAPWEIQLKTDGEWKPVYHPISAQMIIPLENGTYQEWTWYQQLDNGSGAPFGEYRAIINGSYEARFAITKCSPSVEIKNDSYDNRTISEITLYINGLENPHKAFSEAYEGKRVNGSFVSAYCAEVRDGIASEMLFKAYMKGSDVEKLTTALNNTIDHSGRTEMLPCLAVHVNYNGRPSWIIFYNWDYGNENLDHWRYYVIDDETGKRTGFASCR